MSGSTTTFTDVVGSPVVWTTEGSFLLSVSDPTVSGALNLVLSTSYPPSGSTVVASNVSDPAGAAWINVYSTPVKSGCVRGLPDSRTLLASVLPGAKVQFVFEKPRAVPAAAAAAGSCAALAGPPCAPAPFWAVIVGDPVLTPPQVTPPPVQGLGLVRASQHAVEVAWLPTPLAGLVGYSYRLEGRNHTTLAAGQVASPGLTLEGLPAGNTFSLTVWALVQQSPTAPVLQGAVGPPLSVSTTTAFYLGTNYELVQVLTNADDSDYCDILIAYTDFYDVGPISVPTWIGVGPQFQAEQVLSAPLYQWWLRGLQYSEGEIQKAQAVITARTTTGTTRSASATLIVDVPFAPTGGDLGDLSVTSDPSRSSDVALAFTWEPDSDYTSGYQWTLSSHGGRVSKTGVISNPRTAELVVSGLTPLTQYVLSMSPAPIYGVDTTSSISTATATTAPPCAQCLVPFVPSSQNIDLRLASNQTYTATLLYNPPCLAAGLKLQWVSPSTPPTGSLITNPASTSWVVTNIPTGLACELEFVAVCPSGVCCGGSGSSTISVPVKFKTPVVPPANPCAAGKLAVSWSVPASTDVSLTFTWLSTVQFASYDWTLTGNPSSSSSTPLPGTATSVTITGLTPSQGYTFVLKGSCGGGSSTVVTATPVLATTKPDASVPSLQSDANALKVQYLYTPLVHNQGVIALATYRGQMVGVEPTSMSISSTGDAYGVGFSSPNKIVTNTGDRGGVTVTVSAANKEGGDTTTVSFSIPVPSAVPQFQRLPFRLAVPHYSGPPPSITYAGKQLSASSPYDPIFVDVGATTTVGSYANQVEQHVYYAGYIVINFLWFNAQRALWPVDAEAPNSPWYALCFDSVYYGCVGDPCQQGTSDIVETAPQSGTYQANRSYNFAESFLATAPGVYEVSPFVDPPLLVFYQNLIRYNHMCFENAVWNKTPIQLAMTVYGSKHSGEEWWYCSAFSSPLGGHGDPAGTLYAVSPTNPKAATSGVTGIGFDGTPGATSLAQAQAGFNCLERWFMYIAYINQRLRAWIASGTARDYCADPQAISLSDITSDNAMFYQVSAITADGEGNGFPNISDPPAAAGWKASDVNTVIKAMWNKWVNQVTSVVEPLPAWASGYDPVAPAPRVDMPAGPPFTLPCAISMTTPGLIPGMTTGDVGSSEYDAVDAIFHEIYDTAEAPFPFLGAGSAFGGVIDKAPASHDSGGTITGQFFTPTFFEEMEAQAAEGGYESVVGVWDNLPVGGVLVPSGGLETSAEDGSLVPGATPGSLTSVNYSAYPVSPLMNQSVGLNPWSNREVVDAGGWLLRQGQAGPTDNAYALGWALESSRYDLYNGMWAASLVGGTSAELCYGQVTQGGGLNAAIDGAAIWDDLSMGFKSSVASILSGGVGTPPAAVGNIFMLSIQAGPFVNCMSLAASQRVLPTQSTTPTTYTGPDEFRLGFSCPDTSLVSTNPFPGWKGMAGQYWGPYAAGYTGVLQRWCMNQLPTGPNQTIPFAVPINASEDNFGVFSDFDIIIAAWQKMAQDLRTPGFSKSGYCFPANGEVLPQFGLYELGYVPLSWCAPIDLYVGHPIGT